MKIILKLTNPTSTSIEKSFENIKFTTQIIVNKMEISTKTLTTTPTTI